MRRPWLLAAEILRFPQEEWEEPLQLLLALVFLLVWAQLPHFFEAAADSRCTAATHRIAMFRTVYEIVGE